ncbi:unnamed protein product [Cladocopium goreaui]|uniref:2'-phosphotransferase n=1 Tax=Cladocopium goreaui TaxID=2562237 RepID=A0A9P1BH79_9DINO|nr:unnamed protein product [Cladocopium goreaui]
MRGIQAAKKKSPKRNSKDRPVRIVDEEEFCLTWRLDRMARQRLAELPESSRQQAMQRFNPGPEVPESDFPKLFVSFLKRFRPKEGDDHEEGGKGSSTSPSRRRAKDEKPARPPPERRDSSASEAEMSKVPFYHSPGSTPRSFDGVPVGQPAFFLGGILQIPKLKGSERTLACRAHRLRGWGAQKQWHQRTVGGLINRVFGDLGGHFPVGDGHLNHLT